MNKDYLQINQEVFLQYWILRSLPLYILRFNDFKIHPLKTDINSLVHLKKSLFNDIEYRLLSEPDYRSMFSEP